MADSKSMSDEQWFALINGTQTAKPNNPEQQQAQELREALLIDQIISEEQLAKERAGILKRLPFREEKPSQWRSYWQKVTAFFKQQPQALGYIALASLMAVVIIPILTNQQTDLDSDRYMQRKSIQSEAVPYISPQPELKAQEIKQALEKQGLKVELKQQQIGWLLSTELPLDLADRTELLTVLDLYKIELPMGGSEIRLLFVKEELESK
ncbi:hypothetical protein [Lutibacter sp.]